MKRLAIITINYNNSEDTIELLKTILPQLSQKDSIYTLDNASAEKDLKALQNFTSQFPEQITLISSAQNFGFAAGNNLIYSQISQNYKYALFINNDTLASKNLLQNLIKTADLTSAAALTGVIYHHPKTEKLWNAGGKLTFLDRKYFKQKMAEKQIASGKSFVKATFITGCLMLINTAKIQKILIGGKLFDERFFFGQEDFNLCVRLKRAKLKTGTALKAILYHKVSATINEMSAAKSNKIILHFTMRIVDRRNLSNKFNFILWKFIYLKALRLNLCLNHTPKAMRKHILAQIKFFSKNHKICKDLFEKILNL